MEFGKGTPPPDALTSVQGRADTLLKAQHARNERNGSGVHFAGRGGELEVFRGGPDNAHYTFYATDKTGETTKYNLDTSGDGKTFIATREEHVRIATESDAHDLVTFIDRTAGAQTRKDSLRNGVTNVTASTRETTQAAMTKGSERIKAGLRNLRQSVAARTA